MSIISLSSFTRERLVRDRKEKTLAAIPAYNEEECIRDTIEELRLVAPEFNFVVINDGSRDRTLDICRKLHCDGSVEKVGVVPDPKRVGPASCNLEYG